MVSTIRLTMTMRTIDMMPIQPFDEIYDDNQMVLSSGIGEVAVYKAPGKNKS